MANALCERPDLELAAGTLVLGRSWNRRRWNFAVPSTTNVAIDTQAGYLRLMSASAFAVNVTSNTSPATAQSLLVKFRRPTVSGTTVYFYLSSSADNPGGSTTAVPTSAYGVTINAANAPVLNKVAGGTATPLGTSAGVNPSTASQWYWLLLQRTSTNIEMTVWQDGNAQPGTPDLNITDSSVPAGVAEIGLGTSSAHEVDFQQITLSQTGMSPLPYPLTFKDLNGKRVPSGNTVHTVLDDGMNATQVSGLTGTTTQDAAHWWRTFSIPGSGSASVSMPPSPTNDVNAIRLTVRGLSVSVDKTTAFMGFVNGSNQIGIQEPADNSQGGGTSTIVVPSGNQSAVNVDFINEAFAGWYPNFSVELNFRNANPGFAGQLLCWAAEDALLWWVDLPSIAPGSWTPTLTGTAPSTSAVTMSYRQLQADYESGSDW